MTAVTEAEIEAAYRSRAIDGDLGWRFLMTPAATLRTASTIILTLNPGGNQYESSQFSVEDGNGYFKEAWKGYGAGAAPLQNQMRHLLGLLNVAPDEACIGYLVPFRSRSWSDLARSDEALAFGVGIWQRALHLSSAYTVVLMGCHRFPAVRSAFGLLEDERQYTGWGRISAQFWQPTTQRQFIGLPHLSRFRIFGRTTGDAQALYGWIRSKAEPKSCHGDAGRAA